MREREREADCCVDMSVVSTSGLIDEPVDAGPDRIHDNKTKMVVKKEKG